MSVTTSGAVKRKTAQKSWAISPLAILGIAMLAAIVLLSLPLTLPIGPMYWDVVIYYDAANRIFSGQVPILDFFTPVGPLGYYLFAGFLKVFPNAHPTLIAHWSLLVVTAPMMAFVLRDVSQRSRGTAMALLIPFLVFALLPFNTGDFYPFPGSDGFGIYNRQVCQMLYVLVAALLFVKSARLLGVILAVTIGSLFMLKVTGVVAAAIITVYAFIAGRVPFRIAVASAIAFALGMGVLELATGLVSRYITDIFLLVGMNSGTLAPRFLQSASLNFGILAPTVALSLVLLWAGRDRLIANVREAIRDRSLTAAANALNHHGIWLGVVLSAGILFETQNTGSQALIFLWPVVLAVLMRLTSFIARPALMMAVAGLCAAIVLPSIVGITEKAARAYVGSLKNIPLEAANLKALGNVSMRAEVAARAEHMLDFYPAHRELYDDMIAVNELPTPVLYSDFDFQIIQLTAIDRAIDSIRALEESKGVRFETIGVLNFVNPFPYLMDRQAPLHIAIGADPTRAVPDPGSKEEQAIADTDLVLYPTCPPTTANAMLHEMYAPGLKGHKRIKLDACYDAFISPSLADRVDQ